MNKYQKIRVVCGLGLNSERSYMFNDYESAMGELRVLKASGFNSVSIRTYDPNDHNRMDTPHFPIGTFVKAGAFIRQTLKKGFCVLIATPIDPNDCLFCGAAIKTTKNNRTKIHIELAFGPYTVRRVTHRGIIDMHIDITNKIKRFSIPEIDECIRQFYRANITDVLFEFSYYKILVGLRKENFICWEISDYDNKSRIRKI